MSHERKNNKLKLVTMFILNFGFFMVELGVGSYANSMALVADSFHMLSDVAALVVAYFAVKMSNKKWSKNTYGWARAEVLGALVNSVFLAALCFSIFIDAVKRLYQRQKMDQPILVLIVGWIGLLMNLAGLCIFREPHSHSHGHGHSHSHGPSLPGAERVGSNSGMRHSNRLTRMVNSNIDEMSIYNESENGVPESMEEGIMAMDLQPIVSKENSKIKVEVDEDKGPREVKPVVLVVLKEKNANQMNMHGVFLHLMADTLGSVIVVISATVVWLTDWEYNDYIDPTLSIVMVFLILASLYPLLVESSLILLQSVPDHIKIEELERKISKQIDGVIGVHELHVWQLAGDRSIATVHIKCATLQEYFDIAPRVMGVFHNVGIHSATIQPEFSQQSPYNDEHAMECYLSCSTLSAEEECCADKKCCKPNEDGDSPSKSQLP